MFKFEFTMKAQSYSYGQTFIITQVHDDVPQQEPLYIMLNKVTTDR